MPEADTGGIGLDADAQLWIFLNYISGLNQQSHTTS
jgi:hypothetical protein